MRHVLPLSQPRVSHALFVALPTRHHERANGPDDLTRAAPPQAMASGVAVVATHCYGNAMFCEHGVNCLLAPIGDAPTLAAHVSALLTDPGSLPARSRRDRAEIAPRSRRDRAAIRPR